MSLVAYSTFQRYNKHRSGDNMSAKGHRIKKTKLKQIILILFYIVLGIFAVPSSNLAAAPQEAVQLQKSLQHEVAVTLKLIQVYVTDKIGQPAADLTVVDFVVFDNGEKKKITDFEKHVLSVPTKKNEPQPLAENVIATPVFQKLSRKFFLFFDFAYNTQKGIVKAKEVALDFIDSALQPTDEVGVMSYSTLMGFKLNEFLSSNHNKIRKTVEALDVKDIVGRAADVEEEYLRQGEGVGPGDVKSKTPTNAPTFDWKRQESKSMARNYFDKMTALAKALRYVPGKKQIVLFSSGIPGSMLQGNISEGQTTMMSSKMSFDSGDSILQKANADMLKELNSANCTIFAFNTKDNATDLFAKDAAGFEERDKSLLAPPTVSNVFKKTQATGDASLQEISKKTGGKYFANIYEYRKNLDELQKLTGTYYVLGYPVSEQWDGRYHKIKVDVNKKGYNVLAQAGYFNPKPFKEYSDLEKRLHLFDLALSERPMFQTPLIFSMSALTYAEGEEARLLVLSKIPAEAIEKFSGKKVELISVVFDKQENLVGLRRTESDLTKYRGMDVFFASIAAVQPGPYKCRLVIRDLDTGDAAIASRRALVPQKVTAGLRLHSPLFLIPESNFVYIEGIAANKKETISWKDVYPYDRAQYSPMIGDMPQGTSELCAVVPCSILGIAQSTITYTFYLINSVSGEKVPLSFSILNRIHKKNIEILFTEFSLANISPGKYLLYLNAEDAASKSVSYIQAPLIVNSDTLIHPLSVAETKSNREAQIDLAEVLKSSANYCRKLENVALDFVCVEEITEKINRSREIRAEPPGVRYSTRAGVSFRVPAPVLTPFVTNTYVYDYQFIRKDGRLRETRTLLEENRKKKAEKDAKLKTINFVYQNALLGPVGVLGEHWQPYYDYRISGEETVGGRSIVVLDANPKAPNAEIRFLYGKIKIDKETKDILEITWNQEKIGNFEVFEKRGFEYNAAPQISVVSEFSIVKNGIRFPSKMTIEEAYVDKSGAKFVRSETTVTYKDFKFFTVEVEIK
jgi:VWFA-related protein